MALAFANNTNSSHKSSQRQSREGDEPVGGWGGARPKYKATGSLSARTADPCLVDNDIIGEGGVVRGLGRGAGLTPDTYPILPRRSPLGRGRGQAKNSLENTPVRPGRTDTNRKSTDETSTHNHIAQAENTYTEAAKVTTTDSNKVKRNMLERAAKAREQRNETQKIQFTDARPSTTQTDANKKAHIGSPEYTSTQKSIQVVNDASPVFLSPIKGTPERHVSICQGQITKSAEKADRPNRQVEEEAEVQA